MGTLETPSLRELRGRNGEVSPSVGKLRVEEVVADVRELHEDPANAGALFQVASQFNLLEMVSSDITPEMGIDRYDQDRTQGPACAIACGAGTIWRNYFVEIDGERGQTARQQLDMLADMGRALGNEGNRLWRMRNGYLLARREGLEEIGRRLKISNEKARDALGQLLRVGIQKETEVTIPGAGHRVTQVYCSALPVGYSRHPARLWEPFAKLILEAAYEATLYAALENLHRSGNPRVYLTLLGGGAFGNERDWIIQSMAKALDKFRTVPLQVGIVSFRRSGVDVAEMCRAF